MRITNGIIQRSALANLQLNMRGMFEAQEEASTGKRIRTASDDPIGASQVMQANGSLRALDQYKRNIASATSRVDAESNVLDGLTNILERAKELGISQAASTASPATRAAVKAEVDQLIQERCNSGTRSTRASICSVAFSRHPNHSRPQRRHFRRCRQPALVEPRLPRRNS